MGACLRQHVELPGESMPFFRDMPRLRKTTDTGVFLLAIMDMGTAVRKGGRHAHLPQMPRATGIQADSHELNSPLPKNHIIKNIFYGSKKTVWNQESRGLPAQRG